MSPWDNIDNAFEPMICETITFTHGSTNYTVSAFIMTDNNIDPLGENIMDSNVKEINIVTKRSNMTTIGLLTMGDIVTRTIGNSTKTYTISHVLEDDVFGYVVKARSTNA